MADELILHHYDFSNFSEKVRLVLGRKGLAWRSVEIPSTQPKPDYTPLTGGYRRTPALQIGADVFCDTRLIADELERRHPTPSIYPGDRVRARALTEALSPWAEATLLWPLALYVTGTNAERFPPSFHRDRAILHGKPPPSLAQVQRAALRNLDQLRPQLAWVEGLVGAGDFILGAEPGLVDFVVYHPFFLLEVLGGDPKLLAPYPALRAWAARVAAVGAGDPSPLSPAEAIERAHAAAPAPIPPPARTADGLASEVAIGDRVSVAPSDDHSAPTTGTLLGVDAERLSVLHRHERVGEVAVHFPRVGYRLRRIDAPAA